MVEYMAINRNSSVVSEFFLHRHVMILMPLKYTANNL